LILCIITACTQPILLDIAAQYINVKKATLSAWLLGKNPWPSDQKQKKTFVKGLTAGKKIN